MPAPKADESDPAAPAVMLSHGAARIDATSAPRKILGGHSDRRGIARGGRPSAAPLVEIDERFACAPALTDCTFESVEDSAQVSDGAVARSLSALALDVTVVAMLCESELSLSAPSKSGQRAMPRPGRPRRSDGRLRWSFGQRMTMTSRAACTSAPLPIEAAVLFFAVKTSTPPSSARAAIAPNR